MTRSMLTASALACVWFLPACTSTNNLGDSPDTGVPTGLAGEVAAKAQDVAQTIGGVNGFGGMAMDGYVGHMDSYMGFHNQDDLAAAGQHMSMMVTNMSGQACTIHLAFLSSPDGLEAQTEDVTVPPGESVAVDLPCAEIVGVGSLTSAGQTAGSLEDGTTFDNALCVPGFLNSDFTCGGTFGCTLMQDADDLDQDGNTDEFIVVTSAMQSHMGANGMMPHGAGGGMMGVGMMTGASQP